MSLWVASTALLYNTTVQPSSAVITGLFANEALFIQFKTGSTRQWDKISVLINIESTAISSYMHKVDFVFTIEVMYTNTCPLRWQDPFKSQNKHK